jgi:hypothetical protein
MEGDNGQPVRYQGNTVMHLDGAEMLDLNCCLQLSPEVQFCLWANGAFCKAEFLMFRNKQLRMFLLYSFLSQHNNIKNSLTFTMYNEVIGFNGIATCLGL